MHIQSKKYNFMKNIMLLELRKYSDEELHSIHKYMQILTPIEELVRFKRNGISKVWLNTIDYSLYAYQINGKRTIELSDTIKNQLHDVVPMTLDFAIKTNNNYISKKKESTPQEKIDAILDKILKHGEESLTPSERKFLQDNS